MNPSVARVARARIASEADALLDQLADLAVLDGTLTAIEDSFAMHYRTASDIRPQVVSHADALKKAMAGLEQSRAILAAATAIVAAFPDDKTAGRAVTDANTMVARFTRHEAEARKVIRTLAQKQMPPALKAAAAKLKAAASKLLVDPDQLQVIPWIQPHTAYIPGRYGAYSNVETVLFIVVFRIDGIENAHRGRFQVDLRESPVGEPGVRLYNDMNEQAYTGPEQAVELMRRTLAGWPGLKGEADASSSRAPTAAAVVRALDAAISRMRAWGSDPAKVTSRGLVVEGAYRSDLPKEGAREVGSYRYEEMVREEIANWRRVLDPYLAPHMAGIKDVRVSDGEKSWIYTSITLK